MEYIIKTNTTKVVYIPYTKKSKMEVFNYILSNIKFENNEIKCYGKTFIPKRKIYCMGDNGITYKFSGTKNQTHPWDKEILKIKKYISKFTDSDFNFCLINYYPDGDSYISWHSDGESDIIKNSDIVSVNLGGSRIFKLRNNKTKEVKNVLLKNGDILIMSGNCQNEYQHCVPKSKKYNKPRINLTFRNIIKH